MKNINKIVMLIVLAVCAMACNDDFLERRPLNSISDASFWKTTNDLRLYTNIFYARDELVPWKITWGTLGIYSEDAEKGSDTQIKTTYDRRFNGELTIQPDGDGWTWNVLREINYFMDNYNRVEAPFEEIKPYVGETLFFRSIFYFARLRRYGDVPWVSTTVQLDSDILYGERLPRNQVVDSIMADLDTAIEYLPARAGGVWTGRVTKELAMALQARIALYEGTWEKYHANDDFKPAVNQSDKFLEKAAQVAGDLITMSEKSGYPALDNVGVENGYRDLFNLEDYSASKEVLFWRKFEVRDDFYNVIDRYTGTGADVGVTKSMIDSYLMEDGTPVKPGYDDATLVKVAEKRDPRLAQTICINDGSQPVWELASPAIYFLAPCLESPALENCPTGYQTYKGHNYRYAGMRWPGEGLQAIMYFRYGETLLIYAEAKAELGTLTQNDLDRSINKLRERVNMPPMSMSVAVDPNFEFAELGALIQAVRRERKVELALEGHRHDDIMRWAAADELILGKTPQGSKLAQWVGFKFSDYVSEGHPQLERQKAWDSAIEFLVVDEEGYIKPFRNTLNGGNEGYKFNLGRDYLFPIPLNQLTLNPNLGQNPGW